MVLLRKEKNNSDGTPYQSDAPLQSNKAESLAGLRDKKTGYTWQDTLLSLEILNSMK